MLNLLSPRDNACLIKQGLNLEKCLAAFARIDELEASTLERLKTLPTDLWSGAYLGTSGGKDSVAIHHLMTKYQDGGMTVLHTTKPGVTHPATVDFLYSRPYPVLNWPKTISPPEELLTQFDGSRASEFNRNDGRSTDIEVGGVSVSREKMPLYVRNGLFGKNFVFPIFDWTDEDVWMYIFKNKIEYTDEYLEVGPT